MAKTEISGYKADLISNLSDAMFGIESEDYSSVNDTVFKGKDGKAIKPTYAYGKYQFLPSYHLDDMMDLIKDGNYPGLEGYSFTSAEFKKLRRANKDIEIKNRLAPLLNNHRIQDDYFNNWMVNKQLPIIMDAYDKYGKQQNLSVHEVAALSHIKGAEGARELLKESINNPELLNQNIGEQNKISPNAYMAKFAKKFKEMGVSLSYPPTVNEEGEPDFSQLRNKFMDIRAIKDPEQRKKALEDFKRSVVSQGGKNQYNEMIHEYDQTTKDFFSDNPKTEGGKMFRFTQMPGVTLKKDSKNAVTISIDGTPEENKAAREYYMKELEFGAVKKAGENAQKSPVGNTELLMSLPDKSANILKSNRSNSYRKTVYYDFEDRTKAINFQSKNATALLGKANQEYLNITGQNKYFDTKSGEFGTTDFTLKDKIEITDRNYLTTQDEKNLKDIKVNRVIQSIENNGGEVPKNQKTKTEGDETPQETSTAFIDSINERLSVADVEANQQKFNYEPGKTEIPIDGIVGLAMTLSAQDKAKTKMPKRDEEVSELFRNYTAELKKRSEMGLPPEVETAMKNQLAEAYQGGLNNIVNASAGNRATVLGNLGSLEAQKNKGLIGMQVADYEAKERAFAQYGQAAQYIDRFGARRDIANHSIKLAEAQQRRAEGQAIATAGMAKLNESLKYQRENGPGSSNDMYRSMLMQSIYGYDPEMPDNGQVGSKSFYDKNNLEAKQTQQGLVNIRDGYNKLTTDQQTIFNKEMDGQTNQDKGKELIEHLLGQTPKETVNPFANLDTNIPTDINFDSNLGLGTGNLNSL